MPSAKKRDVIFIDRDGVINEDPIGDYVKRWEDFRFIPGTVDALKRLSQSGFDVVIISNQAGIGDGVYSEKTLQEITRNMLAALKKGGVNVRAVYYCLHGKEANCDCRKPKTGLFKKAAADIKFDPRETFFIGDKLSDVHAGHSFGLRTLFVLTGHGANDRPQLSKNKQPEGIFASLKEAVDYVLQNGISWRRS